MLALTAGLFHVFNHSLFKSLLFFGAGAVLTATGERDMDKLGGLIHRMPFTSFVVLVGCVAISALPPFNIEWGGTGKPTRVDKQARAAAKKAW